MNSSQAIDFTTLLLSALLGNVPLGYLREASRKFSVRWFVFVHLSIPFIIFMRLHDGFGWSVVPFTLACAVLGQIVGGRLQRRRRLS